MKRLLGILMLVLLSTTAVGCVGTQASSPDIAQLKKKAAAGNADAQTSLGVAYALGEGVPEDKAEAVKWYRLAAAQGNAGAQAILGVAYSNGDGVPQDYIQAYKWYNLAAASGDNDANGAKLGLAKTMTKEQIAEAQKLSMAFKPTTP